MIFQSSFLKPQTPSGVVSPSLDKPRLEIRLDRKTPVHHWLCEPTAIMSQTQNVKGTSCTRQATL